MNYRLLKMKKHVLVHQQISCAYGMNEKSKVFKYLRNLFFIVDKCLRVKTNHRAAFLPINGFSMQNNTCRSDINHLWKERVIGRIFFNCKS